MKESGEMQLPTSEKNIDVLINGRTVSVNVMQPMPTRFVEDSSLSPSKRSDAVLARYIAAKGTVTLPKRGVKVLPRSTSTTFVCPKEYVKFKMKTNEELDALVEYEVDEEDIEWLRLFNKEMKDEEFLTEETFEKVLDRLEKESFFQCSKGAMTFYNHSVDQDAECCICNDGEVSNVNQIIFCDMCNIPVHQDCYGVPYIPEGIWLCRKCQLSPSSPVECVLCPSSHGAFKQTVDGRWAHVICATWLNEVHFANNVFLEPIDGIEESLRIRRRLRCIICKQKRGACLQCSLNTCTRSFHVTCARAAGLDMRAVPINRPNAECDFKYVAYCHFHSSAFKKEISDVTDVAKTKRKMDDMLKKARRKLEARYHEAPPFSLPAVSNQTLAALRSEVHISETTMQHVQKYWEQKRSARCGVPLIRRLMQNHRSQRVESMRENEPVVKTSGEAFCVIRNWLERTRLLCELVKKREKLKLEYYTHCASMVDRYTKPLNKIMVEVLDNIASKDYSNVFANPVSEKEVPGYSTIIKNPMDLSTMRKKLLRGDYKKLSSMKEDFLLMMHNCSVFNRHNQWFWKYGHRLQRIGLKYFRTAERSLTPDVLSAISSIALVKSEENLSFDAVPSTSAKSPEKSDTDPPVENECNMDSSLKQRRGWKRTPMSLSNAVPLKRMKRSSSGGIQTTITSFLCAHAKNEGQVVISAMKKQAGKKGRHTFSDYRKSSRSTMTSPTDNSTEEYSTADELPRFTRSLQRLGRNQIVEIGYNFEHNDIVWVDNEEPRKIGRVIDLRMKVLMENDPVDDMIKQRPKEAQHTLVSFFGKNNFWKWVPTNCISHCDLKLVNFGIHSYLQDALEEAREFLAQYGEK